MNENFGSLFSRTHDDLAGLGERVLGCVCVWVCVCVCVGVCVCVCKGVWMLCD